MNTITTRIERTGLLLSLVLACLPAWSQSNVNATSSNWKVTSKTIQFAESSTGPFVGGVATLRLVRFAPTNHVAIILDCSALKDGIYCLDTNLVVKSASATLPVRGFSIVEREKFNPDAVPLLLMWPGQSIWGQPSKGDSYYVVVLVEVSERQAQDVAGRGLPLTIRGLLDVPQFDVVFKKEK